MIPSLRMEPGVHSEMACIHNVEVFCNIKVSISNHDFDEGRLPVRASSNTHHVIIGLSCSNG